MATLTATAYSRPARTVEKGVISRTIVFNSGTTEISASATTILLCKIPHGAVITDMTQWHSTGADSCPVGYGIDSDLDALATAATQAVISRATANVPYVLTLSASGVNQYSVFKATATPGTATASLKIKATIFYTMDA